MASSTPRVNGTTTPSKSTQSNPNTPGSWTHPRYNDIIQRQNARTFTDRRAHQIARNAAALFASFVLTRVVIDSDTMRSILPDSPTFTSIYSVLSWSLIALRLLFAYNLFEAGFRAFVPKDLITDIPLTPDQRVALGLPTTTTAGTPVAANSSMYITPPRYSKASPASSRGSINNSAPGTPLTGGLKTRVLPSGSPVGPGQNSSSIMLHNSTSIGHSPLFMSPPSTSRFDLSERRHSFGSPTPKGPVGIGQGWGGGQMSLMGSSMQSSVNPSVMASGKWLLEQRNRKKDFGGF